MKTIEIKVYSFDELSEEAQQKAIESNRHFNVEYEDWYECVYDNFKEQALKEGFNVSKIYFSGFWSQGDGAMFEYDGIEDSIVLDFIETLNLSPMRKQWVINNIHGSAYGKHRGRYYHNGCCSHSIYWQVDNGNLHWSSTFYKWLSSHADEFEWFVRNRYNDLCYSLYNDLEIEYDGLTSDEAVRESLIANEYDYTIDGTIY